MTEEQSKAAWQAANAQARREDKRGSWAECCGRPTFEPVAVCDDCAAAAAFREAADEVRAKFETAFSRNRALAAALVADEKRAKRRAAARGRADAYRSAGMVRTKYGWE